MRRNKVEPKQKRLRVQHSKGSREEAMEETTKKRWRDHSRAEAHSANWCVPQFNWPDVTLFPRRSLTKDSSTDPLLSYLEISWQVTFDWLKDSGA
jgi:hypothetical protein